MNFCRSWGSWIDLNIAWSSQLNMGSPCEHRKAIAAMAGPFERQLYQTHCISKRMVSCSFWNAVFCFLVNIDLPSDVRMHLQTLKSTTCESQDHLGQRKVSWAVAAQISDSWSCVSISFGIRLQCTWLYFPSFIQFYSVKIWIRCWCRTQFMLLKVRKYGLLYVHQTSSVNGELYHCCCLAIICIIEDALPEHG